jgi:hypothetical protein
MDCLELGFAVRFLGLSARITEMPFQYSGLSGVVRDCPCQIFHVVSHGFSSCVPSGVNSEVIP